MNSWPTSYFPFLTKTKTKKNAPPPQKFVNSPTYHQYKVLSVKTLNFLILLSPPSSITKTKYLNLFCSHPQIICRPIGITLEFLFRLGLSSYMSTKTSVFGLLSRVFQFHLFFPRSDSDVATSWVVTTSLSRSPRVPWILLCRSLPPFLPSPHPLFCFVQVHHGVFGSLLFSKIFPLHRLVLFTTIFLLTVWSLTLWKKVIYLRLLEHSL